MPYILTHFYTASRVAWNFPDNHKNETVNEIKKGLLKWLEANKQFREGANAAIKKNDGGMMQDVMNQYKNTILTNESIAIFSAFTAGAQGPDLWMILHSFWDAAFGEVKGSFYFDLGHYNLSHSFPIYSLKHIYENQSSFTALQKKYRTAYVLGYLTHIALDIHSHLKVNVFATAYNQNLKQWETEQASNLTDYDIFDPLNINWPLEGIKSPFNNHNKIEQYFDVMIRYVAFEGYHEDLGKFNDLRTTLEHPSFWDFPNYTEYWDKYLKFGKIIKTNGIYNSDEVFLDLSTSLAGPFAHHYEKKSPIKVDPFVRQYMYDCYSLLHPSIKDEDDGGLNKLESEKIKLDFFRLDNKDWLTSFYYNLKIVVPNKQKLLEYSRDFYNPTAFCEFIKGSINLASIFVDSALSYLETGDVDKLHHLKNWNLDIGLAVRIRKPDSSTQNSPVRLDLISSLGYPVMSNWETGDLTSGRYNGNQTLESWTIPTVDQKKEPDVYNTTLNVSKSQTINFKLTPRVAIQFGVTHNYLYKKPKEDPNEIGTFLFGSDKRSNEAWVMDSKVNVDEDKHERLEAFKLTSCVEDFSGSTGKMTTRKDRKNGVVRLCDFKTEFYGNDTPSITTSMIKNNTVALPNKRLLPRHLRITLCRKWVCKSNDTTKTGSFHPDHHKCYQTIFPSEEIAFSIFAVVENGGNYQDLFHESTFSKDQINSVKMIRVIGVNSIVLIFKNQNDLLELSEAYVDGEPQDLGKTEKDDYYDNKLPTPPTPKPPVVIPVEPDNSCNKLEIEDVMFRTDSAVFLPDGYDDRAVMDLNQENARGLKAISLVFKHAKEFPKQKLLVTAHTDTVASAKYNFDLSFDRAFSVQYILEGSRDLWAQIANRRNHKKDIQTICKWFATTKGWDCDPGTVDGIHGNATLTAIKNLKVEFNKIEEFGRKVPENSTLNEETWGVVFDLYQKEIAKKLSIPYSDLKTMWGMWANRWAVSGKKSIGCSEAFPKDQPEKDEYESPINRRVEILFFGEKWQSENLCTATTSAPDQSSALTRVKKCRGECKIYKELNDQFEYIS